jgi:hypothetical protein
MVFSIQSTLGLGPKTLKKKRFAPVIMLHFTSQCVGHCWINTTAPVPEGYKNNEFDVLLCQAPQMQPRLLYAPTIYQMIQYKNRLCPDCYNVAKSVVKTVTSRDNPHQLLIPHANHAPNYMQTTSSTQNLNYTTVESHECAAAIVFANHIF